MSYTNAVEGYKQISVFQLEKGKRFIETEVVPRTGDAILDLGCGTGELSAYLAELVGPEGEVVGVDPDLDRIKVAQKSYHQVKNLSFVEGSAANFPGIGSEKYNIVFSNFVLHWIPNKEEAFENMFTSLKPGGKIVAQYVDYVPFRMARAFQELNPGNEKRVLETFHCVKRSKLEELCEAGGFEVVKSYETLSGKVEFESGEDAVRFFWATTHGVFDPQLVSKEALKSFCSYLSQEERGSFSVLIAFKGK